MNDSNDIKYGLLACIELLFPAQWSELKNQGAQIIFHLNNAIQRHDAWNRIPRPHSPFASLTPVTFLRKLRTSLIESPAAREGASEHAGGY